METAELIKAAETELSLAARFATDEWTYVTTADKLTDGDCWQEGQWEAFELAAKSHGLDVKLDEYANRKFHVLARKIQ